jgi:hypothetical protein
MIRKIQIRESLVRNIEIERPDSNEEIDMEAIDFIKDKYKKEEIVLTADDICLETQFEDITYK